MFLLKLQEKGLVNCPKWLPNNTAYLVMMGSIAYGCSSDSSDVDVYGVVVPPKHDVFPHLRGEILGFGRQKKRFEQWQEHHIKDKESRKQYDFQIFSIVKYFHLLMMCNPNLVDSIYVPQRCILHITNVGQIIRENRKLFLSKKAWHTFKGYSFQQMHKMSYKNPLGKRRETVEKYGFDLKFAYHIVRLLNEVEQILTEEDLDLERNREQLKAIRRGDWTEPQVREYFQTKERELESLYTKSSLRHSPDEAAIKELLLQCLEHHYGSLDKAVVVEGRDREILRQIKALCERAGVE